MENFILQFLNGLVSGMLLFIMAAGLSLIFGQMNVINLGHGAFYLLGGYIGLSMVRQLGSFWLALLIALANLVGMLFGFRYYAGRSTSLTLEGQPGAAPVAA
jgi:branched-subunit amino acid ABC-type transport system permease component